MQEVYQKIEKVAPTDATVLVTGESGGGKELVARTIHERSRRRGAVRRDQLRRDSAEPDRGRALRPREGRVHRRRRAARGGCFERAEGGTLFLDEITEMPPEMQVRLLRVLETGRFMRVGGDAELRADVRIIAATNRDPHQAVRDGRLREDLMYRLAVFPIALPPLRERDGDAELLAEHFLREFNDGTGTHKRFSRAAIAHASARTSGRATCASSRTRCIARSSWRTTSSSSTSRGSRARRSGECLRVPIGTPLAEIERQAIFATLDHCDGNKRRAPRSSASA